MDTSPVSILILTLDEALNLPRCLASVVWCDDLVVLDSHSSDATRDIARVAGARVYERSFDDYASQRNFGLHEIEYRHPWVLMLDADEEVPASLRDEMALRLAAIDEGTALLRMRRKDFFLGSWLRYSTNYSSLWFGRLVRPDRVRVERAINEEYHAEGKVGSLEGALHHYPFNKGFAAWLEKHNRYSSMEAELKFREGDPDWRLRELVDADPVVRRKALKALVYSLPARPLVMFLGRYLFAGGFLDGRSGLTYCLLKTIYEYMIDCKLRELRRRANGLPV